MDNTVQSVVVEPDDSVAPLVILYILGTIAWLAAVISWVFYFRGYA